MEVTASSVTGYAAPQDVEANLDAADTAGQQDTLAQDTAAPADGTPVTRNSFLPPDSALPASIALQLKQPPESNTQPESKIGAADARAGVNENHVRDLIGTELQRVQSLKTGAGTLVDQDTLRTFDAFARAAGDSAKSPRGLGMEIFDGATQALHERIVAGGYRSYDQPIPADAQDKALQLQALKSGEVDAVNSAIGSYYAAYGSKPDNPSGLIFKTDNPHAATTPEVARFAKAYGQLNENQRGHVLAGIVNNAVQSPAYMDYYRAGGYMRDADKPLEGSIAPWEIVDPRTPLRAVGSVGRDLLAGGLALSAGAGRAILDTIIAKGPGALGKFALGDMRAGAAATFLKPGAAAALEGGPMLVNRTWVSSLKLRSNAELYGQAITRTPAEAVKLLEKVGHDAEMLKEYDFVKLSETAYKHDAEALGYEFDARYGMVRSNVTSVSFKQNIAGTTIAGTQRIPVYVRGSVFESDEAIVQVLSHEIHEIEELRYLAASPISGRQYYDLVRPDRAGNLHFGAVQDGDAWLRIFRSMNGQ